MQASDITNTILHTAPHGSVNGAAAAAADDDDDGDDDDTTCRMTK